MELDHAAITRPPAASPLEAFSIIKQGACQITEVNQDDNASNDPIRR
jgi:hypothetical protein